MQDRPINWKKNIILFLSGQSITLFGSMLVHYAIQWHITLASQSGVAMMLLSISSAAPMFLISPFAGVWADRHSKKLLINVADATIAAVTLIMAILFSFGYQHIILLLICTAARGFGQGIQTPAVNSLLPEIVPADNLTRINAINSSIQSATMFAAPIAGGALIALMPIQTVFFVDVATAAIGISLLLFFVKMPPKEKKPIQQTAWRDMIEGLRYVYRNAFVRKLMVLAALFSLLVTPAAVLTPLQTVRDFGAEEWRLVAIELVFFVGMAVGGAVMGTWGGFKNKSYTVALSAMLCGVSIACLGLLNHFMLYLTCLGLIGLVVAAFNAPLMTVLQVKVDAEYMGRVFSALAMLSSVMMPAGMMIWGPLADMVPIDWLLIVSGLGILVISASIVTSKTLRDAGRL